MRNFLIISAFLALPALATAASDPSAAVADPTTLPPVVEPEVAPGATLAEPTGVADEPSTVGDTSSGHHGDGKRGHQSGEDGRFDLRFDGHLRVEGVSIVPDRFLGIKMPSRYSRQSLPNVGRNDGFVLGDARLNLRGTYQETLYVRLGFDGAMASYNDTGDTVGSLSTGLKDAYVRYTFAREAQIFVGRFKPPYDVEELTPTEDQFFVHRALESRGVERHEGPHGDLFGRSDVSGFAPGRQIGLMLGSDALIAAESWRLGYAVAMTNGNANDAAFNDNDLPALYGRTFVVLAGESDGDDEEGPATFRPPTGAMVGISGFYNELSFGQTPNRYRDRVVGAGIDACWHFMVFYLQGQLLAARTDAVSRKGLEPVYSFGGHLQMAVQVLGTGFFPAYRFALLDPRKVLNSDATATSPDIDRVVLHTVGVRYEAETLPLVGVVEYTHSVEQGGRAQPNDRVEAAMQVTFQ